MRIGIDIRCVQLGHQARGIGRYIFDVVEGLSRHAPEHEYVLIAFPDLPLPERWQVPPPSCRVAMLPTRRLGHYRGHQPIPRVWRLPYVLAQRAHARGLVRLASRERLDALHLPCAIDENYFPQGRVPCRLVKTFLDAIPLIFADHYLNTWPEAKRFVYRRQMRAFAEADAVVAISESCRQEAVQYAGLPPEKVQVVHAAISEDYGRVMDPALLTACLEKYRIRHPYFLFCSAPGYIKNMARIIEAFGRFTDVHAIPYQLVFVSPKHDEAMLPLRMLAFDAGLTGKQFLVTGFVPDEDLAALYSGATALLSPSLHEGFGLPAAQAMSVGTPVIASDRASLPEVVGDAGLLVDPYDTAAIAEAMRCLALDPDLRARLSVLGLERVRRFSLERQARALLDVYQGIPQAISESAASHLPRHAEEVAHANRH